MPRLAYILPLLLFCFGHFAQNGVSGHPAWQIKPSFNQGYVLVHRISIGHLVKGYPAIYEINISKPTLGNKLWHRENNLPDLGVSAQVIDYKNPAQLGYGLVIAPWAEIPFRPAEKKARLVMRLSWGLAYLTKKFDISTNHKNIAIGSHINAFAQFKWFWQIKFNERLRFEPGFAFTHASNGKFRNPNLGLNVVSLNAALNFLIPGKKPVPVTNKIDSSTYSRKKNEWLFFAAGGLNERITYTSLLRTFVVSAAYQRNVNNVHKYSAGLDLFYDENFITDYEIRENKLLNGPDRFRAALRAGYSYNLGRVSFPVELGYYLWQVSATDGLFVTRIGLRYYAANGLVGHFGLRTHFAVAYNFEFGLGYRLPF